MTRVKVWSTRKHFFYKTKAYGISVKTGTVETDNPRIINENKITFTADYPLSTEYVVSSTRKHGFFVKDLIDITVKAYSNIYKNPEKYGIWGHSIEDLAIEGFDIKKTKTGVVVRPLIGS